MSNKMVIEMLKLIQGDSSVCGPKVMIKISKIWPKGHNIGGHIAREMVQTKYMVG